MYSPNLYILNASLQTEFLFLYYTIYTCFVKRLPQERSEKNKSDSYSHGGGFFAARRALSGRYNAKSLIKAQKTVVNCAKMCYNNFWFVRLMRKAERVLRQAVKRFHTKLFLEGNYAVF